MLAPQPTPCGPLESRTNAKRRRCGAGAQANRCTTRWFGKTAVPSRCEPCCASKALRRPSARKRGWWSMPIFRAQSRPDCLTRCPGRAMQPSAANLPSAPWTVGSSGNSREAGYTQLTSATLHASCCSTCTETPGTRNCFSCSTSQPLCCRRYIRQAAISPGPTPLCWAVHCRFAAPRVTSRPRCVDRRASRLV